MNEDLKDLLSKNLEISEKTLKILKGMRRAERVRSFLSVLKWGIVIALTAYSFVQVQPYLDSLLKTYQQIYKTAGSINNLLPK